MGVAAGSLVPFLVAVAFAAGLNLYATTVTLGVLERLHWVVLPAGLGVLSNPWVLGAGALLFLCEVFADKIPFVDLVWNFAHTFIRVPAAALLAYRASTPLAPAQQALVVLMAGIVAAVAHSSKTAARVAVTASPEPLTNIALSSSEDLVAIGLTWVATRHPMAAAVGAGAIAVVAVLAIRWIAGRLRLLWLRLFGRRSSPQTSSP